MEPSASQFNKHFCGQFVAALPAAVCACDTQGRLQYFNEEAVALWGREPTLGEDSWCGSARLFYSDGLPMPHDACPMARVLKGEPIADEREVVLERPDGTRCHVLTHPQLLHDDAGNVIGAINLLVDITDRKATERALEESEKRFRVIADSAPAILGMTDPAGQNTFLSRGWYDFTGQTDKESEGHGWMNAVHPEDVARVLNTFMNQPPDCDEIAQDFRLRRHDGEYRWIAGIGRARRAFDGRLIGFIGSLTDITPRKLAEDILQNANDDLERRVLERTDALRALALELTHTEQRERKRLARVLHDEVQQLLVAIKMQAAMARLEGERNAATREVIRLCDEALRTLKSLVLGLSPPVLRDSDLANALEWLAMSMRDQHGLEVKYASQAVPELAEELRTLIFDVTRELLFNVVKHAGVQDASLRLERNNGSIWIEVSDAGKGCPSDRLVASDKVSFGLFSIRERIAGVGGSVTTFSAPGKGCRVRVSVPVAKNKIADSETLRILIADDHRVVREGLAKALSAYPDTQVVGEASDGLQAIDLARTCYPDVVIMDISLPGMNGIQATRAIRSELPDVRVVGLSMYRKEEMEAAMLDAGADAYVCKGEPIETLVEALRARSRTDRPAACPESR